MVFSTTLSKPDLVYKEMENRILSQKWPINSLIPSEMELCQEFDCGRSTVGKAIDRLVHEGLVERRRRSGTRVIKNSAPSTASAARLNAYAFIYPGESEKHDGIWRTVKGFQSTARSQQRRVITLSAESDYEKEAESLLRLLELDVQGAVIYPLIASPDEQIRFCKMLLESKTPIVLVDLILSGMHCPSVVVDNFHAGYTMTRHLLDQGLTRIGFFANHAFATSVLDRYNGYLWALEEAGLATTEAWVMLEADCHSDYAQPLREPTTQARAYLQRAAGMEGVVCSQDFMAHGLMGAAAEMGLSVPSDLKVTGIDDLAVPSVGRPGLTTYHVPFEQMGAKAFEILDALVNNQARPSVQTRVRGEIVIRESSVA
ncbi:MAG: hypothetical protein B9S32_02825 [Verrucomicrobia bacterium Tous-C9LFEB]|nr:MAG: hypothetical protein B9S32_02825 [Verrucomicrobia bacterium Tous-C9LFEB]